MSALIAALDNALAGDGGEWFVLRRVIGTAPNQVNIDVVCRARIYAATAEQIAAGIPATDYNIIMSPTQINNAQWPGGTVSKLPPFNLDQRVPRALTDKALMRGQAPKSVMAPVKDFWPNGILARIEMRVSG